MDKIKIKPNMFSYTSDIKQLTIKEIQIIEILELIILSIKS